MTKGDNNPADDLVLYNGMKYLKRSNMSVPFPILYRCRQQLTEIAEVSAK